MTCHGHDMTLLWLFYDFITYINVNTIIQIYFLCLKLIPSVPHSVLKLVRQKYVIFSGGERVKHFYFFAKIASAPPKPFGMYDLRPGRWPDIWGLWPQFKGLQPKLRGLRPKFDGLWHIIYKGVYIEFLSPKSFVRLAFGQPNKPFGMYDLTPGPLLMN